MERRKHVTIIRNDEERAADERAAKDARMSAHAWRRAVLNAANGLAKLASQLQKLAENTNIKTKERDK